MTSAQVNREAIFRQVYAEEAAPPRLTAQHLALFRRLRADWSPTDAGAAGIFPFQPLLGAGPALQVAKAILKSADDALATRLLAELNLLVVPIIQRASLGPGNYPIPLEQRDYFDTPASGVDAEGCFQIEVAHVALLKAASWCVPAFDDVAQNLEQQNFWPMPAIDPRRPYGDFTWFQVDMARILGQPYKVDAINYPLDDEEMDERLERLHFETLPALQVLFAYATIKI